MWLLISLQVQLFTLQLLLDFLDISNLVVHKGKIKKVLCLELDMASQTYQFQRERVPYILLKNLKKNKK